LHKVFLAAGVVAVLLAAAVLIMPNRSMTAAHAAPS
jgi:hypothetical protein